MGSAKEDFSSRYAALMAEYAESFDEAPLMAIEDMGQQMVRSHIPPEEIGEMHDAAIGELMASSALSAERIHAASIPLMQLLMAYGIAFREEEARRAMQESNRKLSSAMQYAGESIIITDRAGIIEYVNPAFTRVTGFSAEEAMGQTPRILKSGNQDDAFYEAMWNTITAGKVWRGKVIDRRKDGSFYPAMLTIAPVFDESGEISHYTHFIGIQSDLSELEDMEKRFHQAQKMEAIGTLVGGIAHDFNNILAGITANLYLAKMHVQAQPGVVQRLTNVEKLSHRAVDMIQQLLTFARKGMVSMKAMPLTPFIKETLKFLRCSVPENIALHEAVCTESLPVKGDHTQLHQVLMNLINNARDALEDVQDGPIITVSLEPFYPDDAFCEHHPYFKAQHYAHLSVADNGVGIPAAQIEHLFEPFFTTKEQGKGTGLGLAMVFGAVKTHHGFVEVDSIPGNGSSFHIYLPLLEQAAQSDDEQTVQIAEGRGELILLADDEQFVRETMAEVLESMDYKVLQAKDGLEAMQTFEAHQQKIALALLDVVMPHGGGMPLAKRIRGIKPDVPVLFLTGYDKQHVLSGGDAMPNCEVLTKPVNFDALSHSIRQLLDEPVER